MASVMFKNQVVVFKHKAKDPQAHVYLIHNISSVPLWLVYQGPHRGASAGWSSLISPDKFSVLLMQKKKFVLACQYAKGKKAFHGADCSKMLQVTMFKKIKTPKNVTHESFWVAENEAYTTLFKKMKKRDFIASPLKGAKDKKIKNENKISE